MDATKANKLSSAGASQAQLSAGAAASAGREFRTLGSGEYQVYSVSGVQSLRIHKCKRPRSQSVTARINVSYANIPPGQFVERDLFIDADGRASRSTEISDEHSGPATSISVVVSW